MLTLTNQSEPSYLIASCPHPLLKLTSGDGLPGTSPKSSPSKRDLPLSPGPHERLKMTDSFTSGLKTSGPMPSSGEPPLAGNGETGSLKLSRREQIRRNQAKRYAKYRLNPEWRKIQLLKRKIRMEHYAAKEPHIFAEIRKRRAAWQKQWYAKNKVKIKIRRMQQHSAA